MMQSIQTSRTVNVRGGGICHLLQENVDKFATAVNKLKAAKPSQLPESDLVFAIEYLVSKHLGTYIGNMNLKQSTKLIIAEDNEAVIKLVRKERSLALRHLPRTHRRDLRWLYEVCFDPHVKP